MKILSREQFIELPINENFREVWMYQSRGNLKWHVYDESNNFLTFQEYADFMYDKKDRATKRIYIEKLEPKPGETIAVHFSCGAASAMAIKKNN